MAKHHTFVLPSGVLIDVRSLKGKDQGTITQKNNTGSIDSFNQMLADCINFLGDKHNVTIKDVERMLSNDRKYALVQLRQFSLRFQADFEFNYEWPVKNGEKQTQGYTIPFDKENFPTTPYLWVRNEIKDLESGESDHISSYKEDGYDFPICYDSYDQMLEENRVQLFTTDEGDNINWNITTGVEEKSFSNASKSLMDANFSLRMTQPKKILESDGKTIPMIWKFEEEDIYDVENFRKQIRNVEGYVDTFLTVENQVDSSQTVRINLIQTTDFFFPSQAI